MPLVNCFQPSNKFFMIITFSGLLYQNSLTEININKKYDNVSINGYIFDAATKHSLQGANIYIENTSIGTISNNSGYFRVVGVNPNIDTVIISYIGYKKVKLDSNFFSLNGVKELRIFMQPVPLQYKNIGITASQYTIGDDNTALKASEIEHYPDLTDDAFKSIQTLPGIIANGYDGTFFVRGGLQNELLVEIDGHRIDRPFHFEQFPFGPITSLISYRWAERIDLSIGGFNAKYGDKLSGILKISSKNPITNFESPKPSNHFGIGIDFLNTQAVLYGCRSFGKHKKLGWFFTTRHGHIDQVLKITDSDFSYNVSYYDMFGKIVYYPDKHHTLTITTLFGSDKLTDRHKPQYIEYFSDSMSTPKIKEIKQHPTEKVDYKSIYNWINWKWILSSKVLLNQIIFYDNHPKLFRVNKEENQISLKRNASLWGYTSNVDIEFTRDWFISSGIELTGFNVQGRGSSTSYSFPLEYDININGTFLNASQTETLPEIQTESAFQFKGVKIALYLSNHLKLSKSLEIEVGERFDYTTITEENRWNARFALLWHINPIMKLRFSSGLYDQAPDITDFSFSCGKRKLELSQNPKTEKARHIILGLDTQLSTGFFLRLESYLKNYVKLTNQSFTSDVPLLNLLYGKPDRGRAEGFESFLRYKSTHLSFWMGYSYAQTKVHVPEVKFQIADYELSRPGAWFFRSFDQRHTFSAVLDYTWLPEWHVGVQLISHTGRPYTDLILNNKFTTRVENNIEIPQYYAALGDIQGERYPAHIQLDIKFRRRFVLYHHNLDFYIGILNLLNRNNFDGISGNIEFIPNTNRIFLKKNFSKSIRMTPFVGLYASF